MRVELGRAVRARPGRPARARRRRRRCASSTSRPAVEQADRRRGGGGTASSAPTRLAVEDGAFAEHGSRSGGAALLQLGKAAGAATSRAAAAAAARPATTTRAGPTSWSRRRPRAWPAREFRGHARPARAQFCPVQDVAARSSPRGRAVTAMTDALLGADRTAPTAPRQPGADRPPPSSARSSRRRCARCSSSPAPARARPRRWPRAWSGWSPTATSSPTRCSGLTFTRKAASELAERIGHAAAPARATRASGRPAATRTAPRCSAACPTVSTYHSYAGRLVREHALRLGHRAGVAAAHRGRGLAVRRTRWSRRYDGADGRRRHRPSRPSPRRSSTLAGEMAEHLRRPGRRRGATSTRSRPRSLALPKGVDRAADLPDGGPRTP